MIAKLTGRIDALFDHHLIIDVNGVGYLASASQKTLAKIGQVGDHVSLLVETVVREDAILLYAFADAGEKEWFNILLSVQGVGAKVALAILSVIDIPTLLTAIAAGDKAVLQQADGVGAKLASRLITELKDKAEKMSMSRASSIASNQIKNNQNPINDHTTRADAIMALMNLGYGRSEAFSAVTKVANMNTIAEHDLSLLIRESLKELSV